MVPRHGELVEHCICHAWDTAPGQGESYEADLVQWLCNRLRAAPAPEEGKRGSDPPNSAVPTGEEGQHQPQECAEGRHEDDSGYQHGHKGSHGWGQGLSGPGWGAGGWGNTHKNGKQQDGDPWHQGEPQGAQGEQENWRTRGKLRLATHGAPTSGSSKGSSPRATDSAAGAASNGRPSLTIRSRRPRHANGTGRVPGGRSYGRQGSTTQRCAMGIGDAGMRPSADSPTPPSGRPTRSAAIPRKTPSGSSPLIPGRPLAGAEPRSCCTTPVLAVFARPPSRARRVPRQCTIPRETGPRLPPALEGT